MKDFAAKRWAPEGPRIHVYALPGPEVQALAEVYRTVLEAEPTMRMVPVRRLHLTLGWLPVPAARVTAVDRVRLVEAMRDEVAGVSPMRIDVGPVMVTRYGVRLSVSPDQRVCDLSAVVRLVLRDVFGTAAGPEPDTWTPHIALSYGTAETGPAADAALSRALLDASQPSMQASMSIAEVVMLDADTFAADPWQWDRVRVLPLRQV